VESRTKTQQQKPLLDRFAHVTNRALPQSASADVLVGIGGNEDRWNRVPRGREMPLKFKSAHRGHVNVGDQTSGFGKTSGCEEISRGRESLALRPSDLISLLMDSRKKRSSSTTETHDAFGIRPPAVRSNPRYWRL
jgi:hypothetical protein